MEDVEPDGLLGCVVAFNDDVRSFPNGRPGHGVILPRCVPAVGLRLGRLLLGHSDEGIRSVVKIADQAHLLVEEDRGPSRCGAGEREGVSHVERGSLGLDGLAIHGARSPEGVAHLEAGLAGLHEEVASFRVPALVDHFPESLFPIGVLVLDIAIEYSLHLEVGLTGKDINRVAHMGRLHVRHAAEALGLHRQDAPGDVHLEGPCEQADVHVEGPPEVTGRLLGEVQLLAVDPNADGRPIRGVEHLGEILGVAIFPPTHLRLVRVVDAADIAAAQVITGVGFLVVGTLAEAAVSKAEDGFGTALAIGVESRLHHFPGVDVQIAFHGERK